MIILDENIPREQRELLHRSRVAFRHISSNIGRSGMSDADVIPLLHGLDRPTLFTLDEDYHQRQLCHSRYGLIHLNIVGSRVAQYVRRVLKHPQLNTRAKRMGLVLSASPQGLSGWRVNQQALVQISW